VSRLGEQARWLSEYVRNVVDEKFDSVLLPDVSDEAEAGQHQLVLDAQTLLAEPRLIQSELVRRAASEVGAGEKHLTFGHWLSILELAARNVSGKCLELPGGLMVSKQRRRLVFSRSTPTG